MWETLVIVVLATIVIDPVRWRELVDTLRRAKRKVDAMSNDIRREIATGDPRYPRSVRDSFTLSPEELDLEVEDRRWRR